MVCTEPTQPKTGGSNDQWLNGSNSHKTLPQATATLQGTCSCSAGGGPGAWNPQDPGHPNQFLNVGVRILFLPGKNTQGGGQAKACLWHLSFFLSFFLFSLSLSLSLSPLSLSFSLSLSGCRHVQILPWQGILGVVSLRTMAVDSKLFEHQSCLLYALHWTDPAENRWIQWSMTEWLKLPQKIASGHSNIASHTFSHAGDEEFQGPGTLRTLVTLCWGQDSVPSSKGSCWKHCWKIPMEMGEGQAKEHCGHPGPGRTVLCWISGLLHSLQRIWQDSTLFLWETLQVELLTQKPCTDTENSVSRNIGMARCHGDKTANTSTATVSAAMLIPPNFAVTLKHPDNILSSLEKNKTRVFKEWQFLFIGHEHMGYLVNDSWKICEIHRTFLSIPGGETKLQRLAHTCTHTHTHLPSPLRHRCPTNSHLTHEPHLQPQHQQFPKLRPPHCNTTCPHVKCTQPSTQKWMYILQTVYAPKGGFLPGSAWPVQPSTPPEVPRRPSSSTSGQIFRGQVSGKITQTPGPAVCEWTNRGMR